MRNLCRTKGGAPRFWAKFHDKLSWRDVAPALRWLLERARDLLVLSENSLSLPSITNKETCFPFYFTCVSVFQKLSYPHCGKSSGYFQLHSSRTMGLVPEYQCRCFINSHLEVIIFYLVRHRVPCIIYGSTYGFFTDSSFPSTAKLTGR